jgi:hypothetical protein
MEHFTGDYCYAPLKEGKRELYRNDGKYPLGMTDQSLLLTCSLRNYHMKVTGEIRVLTLLPGSFDDPILCHVAVRPIEEYPRYDALSYMWEDPSATKYITLNDDKAFPVTVALHHALRHLRRQDEARNLWVDAICINQKSIKERSSQVNLMKEIYFRAETVRVWLDVELTPDIPCIKMLLNLGNHETSNDLGNDPTF